MSGDDAGARAGKDGPAPSVRPAELVFPLDCHFRVIAEDHPHMHFTIETILMELGVRSPLLPGNVSGAGKYVSYHFTTRVESREAMDRIDRELRLIVGVRMVI